MSGDISHSESTPKSNRLLEKELSLREREISLQEQEAQREIKLERRGLLLSSPLLVTIASTFFGLVGTGVGAILQGRANFQLERQQFEFSLIRQALEVEDREEAAKQLKFLVDSGIVLSLDSESLSTIASEPDRLPTYSRWEDTEGERQAIEELRREMNEINERLGERN